MWIETMPAAGTARMPAGNSFASNGECGLKLIPRVNVCTTVTNSFASNGECGLKLRWPQRSRARSREFIRQQWRMWIETSVALPPTTKPNKIHSPAMANVD